MNNIVAFFIFTVFSSSVLAQWQIETFSQGINKNEIKSAMVRNEEGFELAIFKTAEGIVWLDFSLSDNNFDQLSQNELPIFQIDDKKPVKMIRGFTATIVPADEGIKAIVVNDSETISTERDFSVNHIVAERLPERVICPIWQGDDRPHLGTIESLFKGKTIGFKYTLLDGTKGQTLFVLDGAKEAISTAIYE
ncbi:MAG: hypothetical protein ACI9FO_000655 [Methylophagaceae bacterium]|jgi:hypothetical protein